MGKKITNTIPIRVFSQSCSTVGSSISNDFVSVVLKKTKNKKMTNEEESLIEFLIHTTLKFIQKLLSLGSSVKAISPKYMKDEMLAKLKKAIGRYD